MHIHILGICGTFMGSMALLAKALGHQVTGSDAQVYPPMSTQLESHGIHLMSGYDPAHLDPKPDCVVIGNALSRGNPAIEYVLDKGIPYTSGPAWLARYVLQEKWVLAVAGTHGKTTTSSILAWILDQAGIDTGFLIGGVPLNFGVSARLGSAPFFVVEADEYDSAFFDKRSKFVHYRPRTLILNNLEFDHADIFPDLPSIERQFHHLVRTVPSQGYISFNAHDQALKRVVGMGCWTPTGTFGERAEWSYQLLSADGREFEVWHHQQKLGIVSWSLTGMHNVNNALAAIAASHHVGVIPTIAMAALSSFQSVKRRMEVIAKVKNITIYDDFAHHPTAISTTLSGLRQAVGKAKILAVIEPRSNSMKLGVHREGLKSSVIHANHVFWYAPPTLGWDLEQSVTPAKVPTTICSSLQEIIDDVLQAIQKDSEGSAKEEIHVVVMSNGSFEGLPQKLSKQIA